MATLVFDEGVAKRLAGELRGRGRPAISINTMGLAGTKDEQLLSGVLRHALDTWDNAQVVIGDIAGPFVLVTTDDNMPLEHADACEGHTIATLHPDMTETEQARHETIHRWAHAMADQETGSIRRYSPEGGGRIWTPRKR